MKEAYKGFSDIINGMTKGEISFRYGHFKDGYWERKQALQKETFANYGGFYYNNDPDVLRLVNEILPKTSKEMQELVNTISLFGG